MTTFHHTPIPPIPLQEAAATLFNSRFSSLDTGIDDALSFGVNNNAELAAARGGYASLAARLNEMIAIGGNIATQANGAASAGQKNVTVDSTTGFVATAYVAYTLAGGTIEYNTIASITPSTVLVLGTNIGTGGIADNTYIAMISPAEYQAANAIHHGSTNLTLPQAMEYAAGARFNVRAYGASPSASQSANATAFQAAIDAAKAVGGTVEIPHGTYALNAALDLCNCRNVTLQGSNSGQPGEGDKGTILECHNTDGAAIEIIGSANIMLADLQIIGHATDTPKVGIWTGRSTASGGANTSQIRIHRVQIYGHFSVAMMLNQGCESVQLQHCYIYPVSTACKAGWMFDWQNSQQLTPEHATLLTAYPSTLCVLDRSFIVSGGETFTNYSPIYVIAEDGPSIRLSYLNAWGAPTIYLKGGSPAWSIDVEDSFSEGNPTYLIHCDYWDGSGTGGPYSAQNIFRLKLRNFGGSAGSSGYSIYADGGSSNDTTLRDSVIDACGFTGHLRFYNVEGSRFQRWGSFDGYNNPTLTVAGYAQNSYFHVNYNDSISLAGNLVNITVDHEGAADSPGAGYMLLTGNKGLAIGGAPGADNQAVLRKMLTASATWNPGAIANGASAKTVVSLTGVVNSEPWVCLAYFSSISGWSGWDISAAIGDSAVGVVITNRSGGDITPASGTVTVIAIKIGET